MIWHNELECLSLFSAWSDLCEYCRNQLFKHHLKKNVIRSLYYKTFYGRNLRIFVIN